LGNEKVNESFEKVASYGVIPNMIFYLMKGYHMQSANGASILFFWAAISNGLAIVGAFLSDAYLGRFRVITLGSFSSLVVSKYFFLSINLYQLDSLKIISCSLFSGN
jgi:peptide/histidine transporter 3/4